MCDTTGELSAATLNSAYRALSEAGDAIEALASLGGGGGGGDDASGGADVENEREICALRVKAASAKFFLLIPHVLSRDGLAGAVLDTADKVVSAREDGRASSPVTAVLVALSVAPRCRDEGGVP